MKTKNEILQRVGSRLVDDFRNNTDSGQYPLTGMGILVDAIGKAEEEVWNLLMNNNVWA